MRGVFLDFDTVSNKDIDADALQASLDELILHGVTPPDQLAGRIADADVVLTNKIRMDAAAINAANQLKLICLAATGFNNVDVEAAKARGVAVANIREYCTDSVAQHVIALILQLTIHTDGYRELLKSGAWRNSPQFTLLNYPVRELRGKVLGIVGYGELGKGVARLAEAFGMQILIAQRPGGEAAQGRLPLKDLLPKVDVLSLHCPLNEHTKGLLGASEFQLMKPDAILINTARGAIVDEQALADALRKGRISGAGIDVLSEEPPVNGNPLLDNDIPNLIVTPHIAWAAREARQRAVDEMALNIKAFRAGEQRNRIV
ncbi:MAG: 2-hydroxyacid dehydrogenase [Gammaproteobacteria bacterium]|nr:2-hydroxyacid dehydrogenase [Gammaproteobacteria bacterium]